jgi:hypothetical protein
MADQHTINLIRAKAQVEVAETIEDLLGEESERLMRARVDAVGSQDQAFVLSMQVAELTRLVAGQQERITALESKSRRKGS